MIAVIAVSSGVDKWRRPLLDRTRPFAVIDRQKRSLMEALQVRPVMMMMMMSCEANLEANSIGANVRLAAVR